MYAPGPFSAMTSFAADVPTMLAMVIASSLLLSAALTVVVGGRQHDGLALWALVLLLNAVAHALLALRGLVPDVLSIVVANTLLSCVFAGLIQAVLQFQGRPARWALVLAPAVPILFLVMVFLDDFQARLIAVSVVLGVQAYWALWAVLARRRVTVGRGQWLLMAGLGLEALVLLVRASLAASLPTTQIGLLQGDTLQTLTFMTTFCVVLLASIGLVTMARERADEANRILATVDALTGAANRRALINALDRDVARATRARTPIALLMVDVDHFKGVNDQHGHLVGDRVLYSVVQALKERVRSQDLVGRYGGEEFLVLLPGTDLEGAHHLACKLREVMESLRIPIDGATIGVTVSIGVFGGQLDPGDSSDMLIDAADYALYEAKKNGRNRVELAAQLRRHPTLVDAGGKAEAHPASLQ